MFKIKINKLTSTALCGAILVLAIFTGCKKNDETPDGSKQLKTLTQKSAAGTRQLSFTYRKNGPLATVSESVNGQLINYSTYEYVDNKAIIRNYSGKNTNPNNQVALIKIEFDNSIDEIVIDPMNDREQAPNVTYNFNYGSSAYPQSFTIRSDASALSKAYYNIDDQTGEFTSSDYTYSLLPAKGKLSIADILGPWSTPGSNPLPVINNEYDAKINPLAKLPIISALKLSSIFNPNPTGPEWIYYFDGMNYFNPNNLTKSTISVYDRIALINTFTYTYDTEGYPLTCVTNLGIMRAAVTTEYTYY